MLLLQPLQPCRACGLTRHGKMGCGMGLAASVADMRAAVQIELRAAELVALGEAKRCKEMSPQEYDWFVHGDAPAHSWNSNEPSDGLFIPETDDEWAGLLAHEIDHHDMYVARDEAMARADARRRPSAG